MLKNGRLYPGTVLRISVTFTDDTGTAVNPTTVKFKTRDPRGTERTYTYGVDAALQNNGVGIYFFDVTPDQHGRWFYRWEATGQTMAKEDSFIVLTSKFSPYDDSASVDYV